MTSLVTRNYRLHCARQFNEQFSEADPSNVYLFIGKSTPWTDDANPPAISDTTKALTYDIWNTMLAMKKLVGSAATLSITRIDWTTGTVYTAYDDINVYNSSLFYVMTDEYNIYKCIFNNNGGASTTKPTGTLTQPFTTADGYVWKFMYTVSGPDATAFLTSDFIPVQTLTADDGSTQWAVQQAAVNGGVHALAVTAGGSAYITTSGTTVSATGTTIVLASGASSSDSVYVNYGIYIISGTGAGQYRKISAYVGGSRTATITSAWTTNPDATSTYVVSPYVTVTGDGSGCVAYSKVVSGAINSIVVVNPGTNYHTGTATITGNTGTGATVRPIMSPIGGHGANPEQELSATNVTVNVKLTGTESGLFFVGNEFRITGLLVNPLLAADSSVASALTYDCTTNLVVTPGTGTFAADELITGSSSGAACNLVVAADTSHLSVVGTQNSYTVGETITGGTSGATATVGTVTKPLIKTYYGLPLYIRNSIPITRESDQSENFRITVKF